MMCKYLILFLVGCSGEPFAASELGGAVSSMPDYSVGGIGASSAAIGGNSSGGSSAGMGVVGSVAGENLGGSDAGCGEIKGTGGKPVLDNGGNGGISESPSEAGSASVLWHCQNDSGVCQCYSDSNHDTLPLTECPASSLCATRDSVACVCWATQGQLDSFLMIEGAKKVGQCP